MDVVEDDLIAEAITEAFGERCPDLHPGCFCCKVWKQYDDLRGERERCAKIAEGWESPLRPGTEDRLLGHQEAARNIAAAIRA